MLQKTALIRQLGKDPIQDKKLRDARKAGNKTKRKQEAAAGNNDWEDENSDDAPDAVDVTVADPAALKGKTVVQKSRTMPSKKAPVEEEEDEDEEEDDEEEEEEDEDEEEDEEEDEDDVALSDIEDEGDLEDVIPHQKLTIDNHAALTSLRNRIAVPIAGVPFVEHQSLTAPELIEIPDIDDDLHRELAFYKQALEAAKLGRLLLKQEKVPFVRPVDYFAEMMKDDEHMGKVKGKLLEEAERKKRSQEARKLRDLKKFGKQVQVAKLQEREKEKKKSMEKIQILKRSKSPQKEDERNAVDQR